MKEIRALYPAELKEELVQLGEKPYRAAQVFRWLQQRNAKSFDEMTDLSLALREKLKAQFFLKSAEVEKVLKSAVDGSRKYLFRLHDGELVEGVFMPYHHGNSVCISTQVGCRMGCAFCASTIGGLARNLSAAEMLEEVFLMEEESGERISNIVLMGSGEPLDNYDNVVRFIRLVTDPEGRDLSARSITLSTSGLPEGILRLAEEGLPVTLALSLHASDDERRKKLMPVARRYPLSEVLSACDTYFKKTGRRVSYEYAVVRGENDGSAQAEALAALLHGKQAHVNLIPVNPVKGRYFEKPEAAALLAFQKILVKSGINATIRRSMGADIEGACGQLKRHYIEEGTV
ncbi:MAG: 23S rRNA (adenine(2503)-C(2))-methyltransferase RlmN [Lachnospiraceae bacterium]|nr:23S rRNA (adenine(2503)-C(2))-methyltransferase RlmN [Lachnospiraceae bacterium]